MLGIGSKAMKFAGEAFHAAGVETYFNVSSTLDVAKTGAGAYKQYVNDSWNNNPNTFANLGVGIAETAGSAVMAGSMLGASGIAAINKHLGNGLTEAKQFSYTNSFGRATEIHTAEKLAAMDSRALMHLGKGTKGWISKEGKFVKAWRGAGVVGLGGMAASLGVSMIGSFALGMAGSLLDVARQTDINRKKMHYDTRYFNTGYLEQNAYQTIGSAMQNYEDKMVSAARVLHSRG